MQIERIFFPVETLGPGRRLAIWTVGCVRNCPNCSNPEMQRPDPAKEAPLSAIISIVQSLGKEGQMIDGITITGGEPFLQSGELAELVTYLREQVSEDILVYTGYTYDELQAIRNPLVTTVLQQIAVLIDGPYVEKLNDNRPLRGSANQQIIILNEQFRSRYDAVSTGRRSVHNVFYGTTHLSIGIPMKKFRSNMSHSLARRGIRYGGDSSEVAPGT